MAPYTLDSEVPPLNAIRNRPGMVKRASSAQQTQMSFSMSAGDRPSFGASAWMISPWFLRSSSRKRSDMALALLLPIHGVGHPRGH